MRKCNVNSGLAITKPKSIFAWWGTPNFLEQYVSRVKKSAVMLSLYKDVLHKVDGKHPAAVKTWRNNSI